MAKRVLLKSFITLAYSNNIKVQHTPHCPKFKGFSLTIATGNASGKTAKRVLLKSFIALAYNNNIEVQHTPHCPKFKGLSPSSPLALRGEKWQKEYC